MRKKIEEIKCDICSCDISKAKEPIRMQVIFTSDQTEGRASKPYFDYNNLDLCENCLSSVLSGNYIFAYGAQGHNIYYFKNRDTAAEKGK